MSHLDSPGHHGSPNDPAGPKPINIRRGCSSDFDHIGRIEQLPMNEPEHQLWMDRGRSAVNALISNLWKPSDIRPGSENRAQVMRDFVGHSPNPIQFGSPLLSRDEETWFMEGALGAISERGRVECRWAIQGTDSKKEFHLSLDSARSYLPASLPDEVWERAKDDRPLVDLPEQPSYWETMTSFDYLGEDAQAMRERVAARKSAYDEAAARFNALEQKYAIVLSWWRGFRQQMIDHNQLVEQQSRK